MHRFVPARNSEQYALKILPVIYNNGNRVLVDKKVKKLILDQK